MTSWILQTDHWRYMYTMHLTLDIIVWLHESFTHERRGLAQLVHKSYDHKAKALSLSLSCSSFKRLFEALESP